MRKLIALLCSGLAAIALALSLGLSPAAAQKTIDQLSSGAAPSGAELVPVFQTANPAVNLTLATIFSTLIPNYVSISAGCGNSTGAGAVQVGSINSVLQEVATTSTAYPITVSNCGQVIYFDSTSNGTPSLPQAGSIGFPLGFSVELCTEAAGVQTITPVSGTIGGQATYVLAGGSPIAPVCIGLTSDGVSNWKLIGIGNVAASVIGPASSVANDVMIFADTTGKLATDQTALQIGSTGGANSTLGNVAIFLKRIREPVRAATSATDFVFSTSDYFICPANSAATSTENLPTSPATGDTYLFKDCTGSAATHPINIVPASGLIDGVSTFILNTAYQVVAVTYTGLGWMTN